METRIRSGSNPCEVDKGIWERTPLEWEPGSKEGLDTCVPQNQRKRHPPEIEFVLESNEPPLLNGGRRGSAIPNS